MTQPTGYKWLTEQGVSLIKDKEVVKQLVKETINATSAMRFENEAQQRDFLQLTMRNKCLDYLKLLDS